MTPSDLADAFAAFFQNPVEVSGAVLSVASIYLLARQRVWGWPIGLVSVALYIPVYWQARLFGDLALYALVYLPGLAYGWYVWTHPRRGATVPVTRTPLGWGGGLLALALGLMLVLGWVLDRVIGQPLAYWDAFTTAFAVAGQLMQARKWLENWLLWIVVDAVAAGVYLVKGLYPTALLYAVFIGLAVKGWRDWRHSLEARA